MMVAKQKVPVECGMKPIVSVVLEKEEAIKYVFGNITPVSDECVDKLYKDYEPYIKCFKDA